MTNSATTTTRKWFDQLEKALHTQAELAGLLGHGTLIGDAREFFISQVLRSVLPPSLHIGSGKVIAHDGTESKQVDVIVYDSTFPVLEAQPGQGLYFVEGVVAVIEVKSQVNEAKFKEAVNNCRSVTRMPPSVMTQNMKFDPQKMQLTASGERPRFRPSAYIFGFACTTKKIDTFTGWAERWWNANELTIADIRTMPEVIVAGDFVGLSSGGLFKVGVEEGSELDRAIEDDAEFVMGTWEVEHQFGWLLIHLLATCALRFSEANKMAIDKYLPIADYWLTEMKGKRCGIITETAKPG